MDMAGTPRYRATPGSKIRNADAQIIGQQLQELGDQFTPADVIAAASDETSPMHAYFDWDDETAAGEHRLHQARQLVRSVQVVITGPEGRDQIRAFHSVSIVVEEKRSRFYTPTLVVRSILRLFQCQYCPDKLPILHNCIYCPRTFRTWACRLAHLIHLLLL